MERLTYLGSVIAQNGDAEVDVVLQWESNSHLPEDEQVLVLTIYIVED